MTAAAMRIYSCHSPSHERLYREHFLPSLPATLENRNNAVESPGSGDYLSPGFMGALAAKLRLMIDSLAANDGQAILWSDVDIIFGGDPLPALSRLLADPETDIWFQKEHEGGGQTVNAGLVLMRCKEAVAAFYREVLAVMADHPGWHDQDAINHLLGHGAALRWAFLPPSFAARSQGWPPPSGFIAFHANCTAGPDGVARKMAMLRAVARLRRFGLPYRLVLKLEARLAHLVRRHWPSRGSKA